MKFSRTAFLTAPVAAYATTGLLRFPAGAAEFTYKLGSDWPANHPITARSVDAASKILQESSGRIEIRVFPSAQLGSSVAMVQQTRAGAIELVVAGYGNLEGPIPIAGLAALPFAFAGPKEANDAMDGPFGKYLRNNIDKQGLHSFDRSWDGGFRQVSNSIRPIRVPDDLKGLKIRVPVSPTWTASFKALGASPTPIDGSEMYAACQTHIVDGTELPLPSIDSFKMYEVQKYASVINYTWTGYVMLANADAWQRLPANLRDVMDKNFNAAGVAERADMVRLNTTTEQSLTSKGMTIAHPDIATFKAVIRASGLFAQWKTTYGAEGFDLLEKAVGKLT